MSHSFEIFKVDESTPKKKPRVDFEYSLDRMNSDCLLAFPIPCFSKKMHTDGEKGLEGRIVVFEGVK